MITHQFRLKAGDCIALDGEVCQVLRVTESSAVVAVTRKPRTFTTRFGKTITIQPAPDVVRISPNAEVPILHRPIHDQRHDLENGFGQSSQ